MDFIWGRAALAFVNNHDPETFLNSGQDSRNLICEALYLIGEAHQLSGNAALAQAFFETCIRPEWQRALFYKQILKSRQS